MDKLKKKYFEEASQLINDLEDALLRLEEEGVEQTINIVFRAVHSLKGGAAIFGFESISDFSHHLESLFSYIRTNLFEFNADIVQIGLNSADILRKLLNNKDENDIEIENDIKNIQNKIAQILSKETESKHEQTENNTKTKDNVTLFFIELYPSEELFKNGTNPLYLIEELHELGECTVFHYLKLPNTNQYKIENCYSSWNIFLLTNEKIESIQDIFLFISEENHIEISEYKVNDNFNYKIFKQQITQNYNQNEYFKKDQINLFIEEAINLVKVKKEDIDKKLSSFSKANKITSVRVDNKKIDDLLNVMSEIVIQQASLDLFSSDIKHPGLSKIISNLEGLTKQLRNIVFDISLIPFSETISRFKRLIFELSQATGKEIKFKVKGEQIELDKNLIELIIDPLIHLIRNCVDHGIEMPKERIKLGKSVEGLIYIDILQRGEDILLKIGDDGKGVDLEKVKNRAIEKNILKIENKPTNEELLQYIFLPGFSTSKNITEISGRGVGMDVVKQNIERLRGSVKVKTEKNKGTEFDIQLPVTVSIQDGFIFSIGHTKFVLPAQQVHNFSSIKTNETNKLYKNLLNYNGNEILTYHLANELKIKSLATDISYLLILQEDNKKTALIVDQIHTKQQFVIKPLGRYYKKQYFLTGGTILGNGEIALIIDSRRLLEFLKNKEH